MKTSISLVIRGFIIHFIINFNVLSNPEIPGLGLFLIPFTFINLIGLILILKGKQKIGANIFIYSSVIYVPIGLIGALGARNILNVLNKEAFLKAVK